VYPGEGIRWTYFDTSRLSHALNEPCWIVEPHPPGTQLVPNGLPVFTVYYENDDDSLREWGSDSRLTFTAPSDGDYHVRITDVRGFAGEDYKYELRIRRPQPDFAVTFDLANESIPPGLGREFRITARRTDGFDGEIRVEVSGLPPGFRATSPVIVEPGQIAAYGTIHADAEAAAPDENASAPMVVATAEIGGESVRKDVAFAKKLKLGEPPKVLASVHRAGGETTDNGGSFDQPFELSIAPGETISAIVRVDRRGDFEDQVHFGNEDAGRNLPHGVFVDNIGLNGLMVTRGTTEREFFITAADWVPETSRLFHLKIRLDGDMTTLPVLLHVRHSTRVAQLKD
jgi:hypothetical protein